MNWNLVCALLMLTLTIATFFCGILVTSVRNRKKEKAQLYIVTDTIVDAIGIDSDNEYTVVR